MRYCAFLRGVNVNGTAMKMADVCEAFAGAGASEVTSVLASGNIIFSSEDTAENLRANLEKALSDRFNYEAFLFLKTPAQIRQIAETNPFPKEADFHIYIFVGERNIERRLEEQFLATARIPGENAKVLGDTFYWRVPKTRTLESSFGKILGKKEYKSKFTSRNLNTLEKIRIKMQP